jgi:hypothetical protein
MSWENELAIGMEVDQSISNLTNHNPRVILAQRMELVQKIG